MLYHNVITEETATTIEFVDSATGELLLHDYGPDQFYASDSMNVTQRIYIYEQYVQFLQEKRTDQPPPIPQPETRLEADALECAFHGMYHSDAPNTSCWEWIGQVDGTGEPIVWLGDKLVDAKSVAWCIGQGIELDMLVTSGLHNNCLTRLCVNPTHIHI